MLGVRARICTVVGRPKRKVETRGRRGPVTSNCRKLEERTPPKPSRPKFGAWTAPPKSEVPKEFWDRAAFAGPNAEDQAERLVAFLKDHDETLRPITLRNKKIILRRILRSFAERGKDLSTLTQEDCAAYREYLRDLATKGVYALDTAAYSVRNWNATMRRVFGETGKPGEGLLLKTFGQRARRVEHLNESEMSRLIEAADRFPFRWDHTRLAFKTYLEVEWATGARFGSLFEGRLLVKDIDWERQVLVFRHMKNKDHHTAVLTPRAAVALKKWCDHLATQPFYKGDETAVFVGPGGKPPSTQWLNKSLQGVAGVAGITKKVSTHMLRKSVGTLTGARTPSSPNCSWASAPRSTTPTTTSRCSKTGWPSGTFSPGRSGSPRRPRRSPEPPYWTS
jgi:site-specific recombinase XerD